MLHAELTSLLAAIVDSSQDAILSKTLDGVIISWNPAAERLYGYTADEIIGKSVSLLVPADRPREVRDILARVIQGEAVQHFESYRVCKDRSIVSVSLSISPVRNARGRIVAASTIARDNTERNRQADLAVTAGEVLEGSRLKSEFLAMMSHEIRTPMNSVVGMAGLLLDTHLDIEQREYAEAVRTSGQALLTIINDILDFSKIEAGHLRLEEIDFSPSTVVAEVVELLVVAAHEKGLELIATIDPAIPPVVRGDPGRIRQVLMNLVGNAVKFTDKGEVVVMATPATTAADAGTDAGTGAVVACFEVRDSGIGIAREDQARLFESFTQADASINRRFGGSGLGLTISRRLVELMGGAMAVDSTPGVGSTFSFTVALRGSQATATPAQADAIALVPDPVGPAFVGARILVADDNALNQRLAILILEKAGYQVDGVSNGVEAVDAVTRRHYDGLLMDCHMPVMDGYAACTEIRRREAGARHIPIIAVTASAMAGDAELALAAGMDDHVPKPIDRRELHIALNRLLGPLGPTVAGPARQVS